MTDEERNRYGLLLDSAAERGLLDPTDYEMRLRELAQATTTAQMVELVAELPAFAPAVPASAPTRSRRAIQSANRAGMAGAAAGQRRRLIMWVLMGLLVVVAVASLDHPGPLGRTTVTEPELEPAAGLRWRRSRSVPFASEELLQLGGDLVAAGHVHIEDHRWHLFGVEGGLQPPDHLEMLGVGPDEFVHLTT